MYASLAMARASAGLTLVWAIAGAKRSAGSRAMPPEKTLRVMDFMVVNPFGRNEINEAAKRVRSVVSGHFFQWRLLPLAVQRLLLWVVEPQIHAERPAWCRKPIRLLVFAGAFVLDQQCQAAICVLCELRHHGGVQQVAIDRIVDQQAFRHFVHGQRPERVDRWQLAQSKAQRVFAGATQFLIRLIYTIDRIDRLHFRIAVDAKHSGAHAVEIVVLEVLPRAEHVT